MRQVSIRSVLFFAVAAFVTMPAAPAAAGLQATCPGYDNVLYCAELNDDCKVTANDALLALKMSVGQQESVAAADLDHSSTVTAGDALRILRIAVGSVEFLLNCSNQYSVRAANVGFYTHTGTGNNAGYAVGWYNSSDTEIRDYFVFDVSDVPTNVVAGVLHVSACPDGQTLYPSVHPSENFTLFHVSTPLPTLTGGTGGVAAFNDLAEGTDYGTLVANNTIKRIVNVPLNVEGIDYVNAATDKVVFGGAITTLAKGDGNEYLFNSTHVTTTRELVLTIGK